MRTKRKAGESMKGRPKKLVRKFKKQTDYDSGSGDDEPIPADQDFRSVNLADTDSETEAAAPKPKSALKKKDTHVAAESSDDEPMNDEPILDDLSDDKTDASNSDSESDSDASGSEAEGGDDPNKIKIRNKRNDPEAFATSMSKILGSKLSASKRSDPVLARSINAAQASKEITDLALEKKARQKLREEKRAAMDKGRVKDVLGASTAFDAAQGGEPTETVQQIMEEEKRLRKTAQRGVVRMFNAVRAAQIKGEQAAREARERGLVGAGRREEKVNEMSKQGFLELISGGGGGLKSGGIEEA